MNAGDTFRFSYSLHLWVVVSDPRPDPDSVLLVSFTSNKSWQDQACVLQPGDHRYISKETVLYYAKAKLMTDADLDAMLAAGELTLDDPVSTAILARIREGGGTSRDVGVVSRAGDVARANHGCPR